MRGQLDAIDLPLDDELKQGSLQNPIQSRDSDQAREDRNASADEDGILSETPNDWQDDGRDGHLPQRRKSSLLTEAGAFGRISGARRLGSIRRDVGLNRLLWNLAETYAN